MRLLRKQSKTKNQKNSLPIESESFWTHILAVCFRLKRCVSIFAFIIAFNGLTY